MDGRTFFNRQLLQWRVGWKAINELSVRTGAGPGGRKVARLCLLQYGAANAAPIKPEAARRSTDSKITSSSKSWP